MAERRAVATQGSDHSRALTAGPFRLRVLDLARAVRGVRREEDDRDRRAAPGHQAAGDRGAEPRHAGGFPATAPHRAAAGRRHGVAGRPGTARRSGRPGSRGARPRRAAGRARAAAPRHAAGRARAAAPRHAAGRARRAWSGPGMTWAAAGASGRPDLSPGAGLGGHLAPGAGSSWHLAPALGALRPGIRATAWAPCGSRQAAARSGHRGRDPRPPAAGTSRERPVIPAATSGLPRSRSQGTWPSPAGALRGERRSARPAYTPTSGPARRAARDPAGGTRRPGAGDRRPGGGRVLRNARPARTSTATRPPGPGRARLRSRPRPRW